MALPIPGSHIVCWCRERGRNYADEGQGLARKRLTLAQTTKSTYNG